MRINSPPQYILEVLLKLKSEGYDAFLVGGCIRNAIIGVPIKDWDVCTSAKPVEVAGIFPKTVLTGERFGTITVVLEESTVEVTTYRTDGEYIDCRHPKSVEFASSLHEDLSRRDFTINAMASSVDGELVDPFGGLEDIGKGIIRCVGGPNTRFSEDALRMFRAFRFSAVLGFEIEEKTLQAIYANAGRASLISSERIAVELEKILMSQKPETIGKMIKIGLLGKYVDTIGKTPQNLERISNLPQSAIYRWGALFGILLEEDYIKDATKPLNALRLPGKTVKTCLRALQIRAFEKIYNANVQVSNSDLFDNRVEIKKLLSENDAEAVRCAGAISQVLNPKEEKKQALSNVNEVIESGECTDLSELAVSGNDLVAKGHPPGRELGETLRKLLMFVIENPQSNDRETLLGLVERNR